MEQDEKNKTRSKRNQALAFSGIGMQMLVTILLFYYIGTWIDGDSAENSKWTLILTLTGVGVALYSMIKGLLNIVK